MQMTNYKLSFEEMRSLMLFLRDVDWDVLTKDNMVLAKFIHDTSKNIYEKLEKRGLRIILDNKRINKPVKFSFSDLEMLSISLLAKHPHENSHINMVINKILLKLPIEVINVLTPIKNEKSID